MPTYDLCVAKTKHLISETMNSKHGCNMATIMTRLGDQETVLLMDCRKTLTSFQQSSHMKKNMCRFISLLGYKITQSHKVPCEKSHYVSPFIIQFTFLAFVQTIKHSKLYSDIKIEVVTLGCQTQWALLMLNSAVDRFHEERKSIFIDWICMFLPNILCLNFFVQP